MLLLRVVAAAIDAAFAAIADAAADMPLRHVAAAHMLITCLSRDAADIHATFTFTLDAMRDAIHHDGAPLIRYARTFRDFHRY